MKTRVVGLIVMVAWLSGSTTELAGRQTVELRVSPRVIAAPGTVRVQVFVEPDANNHSLEIAADSGEFYRSSLVPLAGDRAPRVNEMALRSLPAGEYEIVANVRDRQGRLSVARTTLLVVSMLGGQ